MTSSGPLEAKERSRAHARRLGFSLVAGLVGVTRRAGPRTTRRDATARPAPDLVQRAFAASGSDQLGVADITYVPTWAGFLYPAVVVDAWSRRVVGWAMATQLRQVIHHSDQGCQYTALAFGQRCCEMGVRPSMGSVGDAYDNALCKSFFATLETELLDRRRFPTQAEARLAVFDFIEGWYIPHRRHSSLDYLSPIRFERRYQVARSCQAEPVHESGAPPTPSATPELARFLALFGKFPKLLVRPR